MNILKIVQYFFPDMLCDLAVASSIKNNNKNEN